MNKALLFSLVLCALGSACGQTTGAPTSTNTQDDGVQAAAAFFVQQLNTSPSLVISALNGAAAAAPFTLVAVLSAQQQVVSGIRYMLRFQVKDKSGQVFTLEGSVVAAPWKQPPNVIESLSLAPGATPSPSPSSNKSGMGTLTAGNTTSPQTMAAVAFCLQVLNTDLDRTAMLSKPPSMPFSLSSIHDVQQQVVAGTRSVMALTVTDQASQLYSVSCSVVSQPWITDFPMKLQQLVINSSQATTNGTTVSVVGGLAKASLTDPLVKKAAAFCLQQVNKNVDVRKEILGQFGCLPKMPSVTMSSLKSAQQQVVSGAIYFLGIEMKFLGKKFMVNCSVWSQPWVQDQPMQLTSIACHQ